MPLSLRTLSRLLAAVLAFVGSPLSTSARLISSTTGIAAAKRFDPIGSSGCVEFVCPPYNSPELGPVEATDSGGKDAGSITACEYFITD